ncbi:hypothetical protein Angca_005864, partial [Angiostrongylus cantonensis]
STLVVLNEEERVQKRELIKGNRERRHLEQLVSVVKGPPLSDSHLRDLTFEINLITKSYCRHIDQPMVTILSDRMIAKDSDDQLTETLRPILPLVCQMQLLHSSILEMQLLRFASFFDETADTFRPNVNISFSHSELLELLSLGVTNNDEIGELHELLTRFFALARSLAVLQLDDRILAVLSAMFIFDPSNMLDPSVVDAIVSTYARLDEMLHTLIDEGSDGVGVAQAFARLLSTVTALRCVCRRLVQHFTPQNVEFLEKILGF